jgi:hypothetical protein
MRMLLIVFGFFLIVSGAHAQRSVPLKGPQAKNYHPLKAERGSQIVARAVPLKLKGPKAKNSYHREIKRGEAYINVTSSPRMRLKGPSAKNYQPRIQKSFANVFRNRNSEE